MYIFIVFQMLPVTILSQKLINVAQKHVSSDDMAAAALSDLVRDKILMRQELLLPRDASAMIGVYITNAQH